MKIQRVRAVLVGLWWGAFVACLLAFGMLYGMRWIEADTLLAGLGRVSSLYFPFLGVITSFYFGHGGRTAAPTNLGISGWLALMGSFLWNIGPLGFLALVFLEVHGADQRLDLVTGWTSACSVIVAPALVTWFRREDKAMSVENRD